MDTLNEIIKLSKKCDKVGIDIERFVIENDIDFSSMNKFRKLLNAEIINNRQIKQRKSKNVQLEDV